MRHMQNFILKIAQQWLTFCTENEQGIFDAVLRGHLDFSSDPWPSISSSAKDLVKKMLRLDPKERLSATDVLSKFKLCRIFKVL